MGLLGVMRVAEGLQVGLAVAVATLGEGDDVVDDIGDTVTIRPLTERLVA